MGRLAERLTTRWGWALLGLYITGRVGLLQFNHAEWGDTYSFLAIAESLLQLSYPTSAKRLPFFPLTLAVGMTVFDEIWWGRVVVSVFSCLALLLTWRVAVSWFGDRRVALLASVLLAVNPTFLYWSVRVMAEVVLAVWVLLAFYVYYRKPDIRFRPVLLGLFAGSAAMTRYEGFLLMAAVLVGLAYRREWRPLLAASSTALLICAPWLARNVALFGDPAHSSYLVDPGGFRYDLQRRVTYVLYLVFVVGFPLGIVWVLDGLRRVKIEEGTDCVPLITYAVLDLLLIGAWGPDARFFSSLLPFQAIFFSLGLVHSRGFPRLLWLVVAGMLLTAFGVGAFFSKPYFLAGSVVGMGLTAGLAGLVALVWLAVPQFLSPRLARNATAACVVLSSILTARFVLVGHRFVYGTVHDAVRFLADADGVVAFSDVTGVTAWYLRQNGVHLPNYMADMDDQRRWLREQGVRYVLWTNEHHEGASLDVVRSEKHRSDFQLLRRFEWLESDPVGDFVFDRMGSLGAPFRPVKDHGLSEVYRVVGM